LRQIGLNVKTVTLALLLVASSVPALAQVLPQPKVALPGGSWPFGYTSSGACRCISAGK
jgi:hypothetical protein